VFTALHYSAAINVGIVFSVWPITAVILAAVFPGDRLTPLQIFGIILCFAGVLVVIAQGNPDTVIHMGVNTGDLLVFAAVVCFSFYTVMIRKSPSTSPHYRYLFSSPGRQPLRRQRFLSGKLFMIRA
jgi:drug/metabolite transporter (DMT)-like permease